MIIDVDNRQAGKTTTLIMDSYFSGVPILTTNVTRRNNITYQAQQMGMNIEVYTISDLRDVKERPDQIMIDELEDVLSSLLGVKVVKATMSRKGVI